MHVTHDCPTARAVWAAVADTWEAATTEPLDITDPTLTVLASGHSRQSAPSAGPGPGITPGSQRGNFSMRSPC